MIVLPNLPYKKDALEPYISERTVGFHYEKHHAGYVKKLNDLIEKDKLEGSSLEEIILSTQHKHDTKTISIFNNAAQVWNHTFYWESMQGKSKIEYDDELMKQIKKDYGNIDILKGKLSEYAVQQFGSGWTWLVFNKNNSQHKIEIINTSNADTPFVNHDIYPLLAIDVWEHAYYLDYQNRRLDYVKEVLDNLINWKFASNNYLKAVK
jgi:Fe-Mn family superoxide dismutase